MKRLRRLFARSNPREDALVTLMQVALEDPQVRHDLLRLLNQPAAKRTEMMTVWVAKLGQEGAPRALLDALDQLRDESRADRAISILKKE